MVPDRRHTEGLILIELVTVQTVSPPLPPKKSSCEASTPYSTLPLVCLIQRY